MRYLSTRNHDHAVGLESALQSGIAPDGGLYVPAGFPSFCAADFDGLDALPGVGERLLEPFFAGSALERDLRGICTEALDFPIPLTVPELAHPGLGVLELFHGPTAAFKDVGARFLAACLQGLAAGERTPLTILVATSGDTGGAVAAAFHQRAGAEVVILYPAGGVSARQEQQLTCWSGNVRALAVQGTFDDCQRLVKEAFQDDELKSTHRLGSANSINIGRLLPQTIYYALAGLEYWRQHGRAPNFIVPTGNLGNALASIWARHIGLPIGEIVLATNANRPIPDYLESGVWEPRPSIATLASAMDVGDPSNMERLRDLYPGPDDARRAVRAYSVNDEQIRQQITAEFARSGKVWCPHTATAMFVYREHLSDAQRRAPWIVVATAHAAKFDAIVEPLTGERTIPPPELAKLLELPARAQPIDADPSALRRVLQSG